MSEITTLLAKLAVLGFAAVLLVWFLLTANESCKRHRI